MTLTHTLITALKGVRVNTSRSALTILGIVIGITAIIIVMSMSSGAKNLILSQVEGLGSQTIIIEPGREPKGPSEFAEILTDSLKNRDVELLTNKLLMPSVAEVSPNVVGVFSISYQGEATRNQVIGSGEELETILSLTPESGSFFTKDDVQQHARVAIIGQKIEEKLFGTDNGLEKNIKIKDAVFKVIGILPKKGQVGIFNTDDLVIVPHTSAQQYLIGGNHFNSIMVRAASGQIVNDVAHDITYTLRDLHGITDPDKDDFHITTQEDIAKRVGTITGILSALLGSIAAISLVVGGIGIMNIMLVSVTERTREIGLRKALGATNKDILSQFLFESIVLTATGGIIGILLGALISFVASLVLSKVLNLSWAFSFPLSAALLGLGVSGSVGLVFGIYPARQASKKSPMEALRYE